MTEPSPSPSPSPSPAPSSLGRLADLALFAPIGLVCRLRDEVPHLAEVGRARVEGQVRLARLIGEMAVKQGRREVVRRLDEVAEQRRLSSAPQVVEALLRQAPAVEPLAVETSDVEQPVVEAPVVETPAVKTPAVKTSAVKTSASKKTASKKSASKKSAVNTPAVKKSAAKPPAVEKPVVEKQMAGAAAVTAPAAAPVDATTLPISDYDSLAASQVVARLEALGPDDLTAIGSYEAATRGRRTILGKVHQLQAR